MNIQTSHDRPPIPTRDADWSAVDQDTYDGAEDAHPSCQIIGRGATEREAINNLVEQLVDQAEEAVLRDAVVAARESLRMDAATIAAKDARIARLESDLEAMRENMLELQRDAREAIQDAAAEARREERTGDPYGTY